MAASVTRLSGCAMEAGLYPDPEVEAQNQNATIS